MFCRLRISCQIHINRSLTTSLTTSLTISLTTSLATSRSLRRTSRDAPCLLDLEASHPGGLRIIKNHRARLELSEE